MAPKKTDDNDDDLDDLSGSDPNEGGESSGEKEGYEKPKEPDLAKIVKDLQDRVSKQDEELARLRNKPPEKTDLRPNPKVDAIDWETELFTNTNEAIKKLTAQIRQEVAGELTQSYRKDQGEKQFWTDFYKSNKDLKEDTDDDLVKAMLAKHYNELADLPTKKAGSRLAELTRERIMQYTGKTPKGSGRAVAEGSSQGTSGTKSDEEPPKPATLSDIIRARRAKRYSKQKATAA